MAATVYTYIYIVIVEVYTTILYGFEVDVCWEGDISVYKLTSFITCEPNRKEDTRIENMCAFRKVLLWYVRGRESFFGSFCCCCYCWPCYFFYIFCKLIKVFDMVLYVAWQKVGWKQMSQEAWKHKSPPQRAELKEKKLSSCFFLSTWILSSAVSITGKEVIQYYIRRIWSKSIFMGEEWFVFIS